MTSSVSYQDHVGLWRDELQPWLPETIFDAHTHLGPEEAAGPLAASRLEEPLSTFTHYRWEEATAMYEQLFSGKTIAGLIAFGFPLREVNLTMANDYIARLMQREPRIHGFIVSDPKDTQRTICEYDAWQKRGVRFRGVKPYYDLLGKPGRATAYETQIAEFVPRELLEFMDAERLPVMLHTSRVGMGDPECQRWVAAAAERFPRVTIILAHMGRYTDKKQFLAFMESRVWQRPNICLEMSSATEPDVYRAALEQRELWSRLLFGSDVPFGLITGQEHTDPETGPTFITRDVYSWTDRKLHERFSEQRKSLTYNTYHTLHALKTALDSLRLSPDEEARLKADVFLHNAQQLLKGTPR